MTHPSALDAPSALPPGPTRSRRPVVVTGGIPPVPWRFVGPVWPLLVVLSALTVEVRFVAHSAWRPVFLYDGDSLTFPVLWHALAHGEPMHPVMSSQLLLFPEGLIYALAHFATTSIAASLVAVAYLNVTVFYLGLRAIAAVVVDGSVHRRRLAAAVPTLLLIAAMLLERRMGVDTTTIATPLLFDSFYGGVILVGIGAVGFAVRQLRWAADRSLLLRLAASSAATAVLALTIISDPLFLLQVTAPFLFVGVGLWALRLLRWRQVAWLAGPQLGAVVLYKVLTPLYGRYVGETTKGYVHLKDARFAYRALDGVLHKILATSAGRWEVALVAGAWAVGLVACAGLLGRVRRRTGRRRSGHHPGRAGSPPEAVGALLASAFAVVASVSVIAGIIAVGQSQPRYLLPVVTCPFVALVPVASLVGARRLPVAARLVPVTLLTAVGVLGLTALPGAASLVHPEKTAVTVRYGTPLGESCLERAFDHRPANGVAAYWTARALDLYNPDNERVLQVRLNQTIFTWLVNLGTYEHRRFTFVLVDKFNHAEWTMRPHNVRRLGRPARIVSCPGFDIYTYPPGTVGYQRLNRAVDRSLAAALKRYA